MYRETIIKGREILFAVFIFFLFSCSDTRFVIKMHNQFVENFRSDSNVLYPAEKSIYYGGENWYYVLEKNLHDLNTILPNPDWDSTRPYFMITSEYLIKLEDFVQYNHKQGMNKLDLLNEVEEIIIIGIEDSIKSTR